MKDIRSDCLKNHKAQKSLSLNPLRPQGKKGKVRKVVPSPAVALTSKGTTQKTGNLGSTQAPTPPTSKAAVNFNSEAIAILREMNSNQNKANANFEKLSQCVDKLYNMQGEYECEAEAFPVYDTQSEFWLLP